MNKKENHLIEQLNDLIRTISIAVRHLQKSNPGSGVYENWQKPDAWKDVIKYVERIIKQNKQNKITENELSKILISLDKNIDLYSLDKFRIKDQKNISKIVRSIVNTSILLVTQNISFNQNTCGKHEDSACESRAHSSRIINPPATYQTTLP